jgi:2-polyprenyl-6-methoxyphenol hydroxylase-like FAD-dependent oxidoreductase
MRHTDVLIIGGGLSGSLTAAMLRRANIDAVVVDPHVSYPPDFRCEKLDETQLEILGRTGLGPEVLACCTPYRETWVARFGFLVEKRREGSQGVLYDTLVNRLRELCLPTVPWINDKAIEIQTGPDRQKIKLASGEQISARLIVISTGLNIALVSKLGVERNVISKGHSIAAAFNIEPVRGKVFPFSSMTFFAERPSDRMAYITLFPVGNKMRVNLFGYRDLHDPWMRQLRTAPQETLYALWPRLRNHLRDFIVSSPVQIRPVDLYVTKHVGQDGIVLLGDAFSTSCPAAGTGARKVLTDVERLCNGHIRHWLASPGMGREKLASFYEDPIKQECDAVSAKKAFELKAFSTSKEIRWIALRWAKFFAQWSRGRMLAADLGPSAVPKKDQQAIMQLARR